MKIIAITAALVAAAAPACADPLAIKPLAEARLRHEHVTQDGLPLDADAVTTRIRSGVEARTGGWSALVEAQGTLALVDHYNDGLNGPANRATVSDPENVAIYRAQLGYRATGIALTAGRQRITLDDEKFVGAAGFRDNGQTFDAVRAELTPLRGLKLDVSYAWAARTIWGVDGRGARPTAIGGDNVFVNVGYATPLGTLTGFAYLVDQDMAAVQNFRLSSQTYGGRLAGTQALPGKARLAYQFSYARQSDRHRNPNDYAAGYYLADAGLDWHGARLGAGYEVMGADKGAGGGMPLGSFQAPFGSVFKFQGWADKFTATPPDGVRDRYVSAGYGRPTLGPATKVSVQAVYHRFDSDRRSIRYGDEIDLLAQATFGRTTAAVRYATYRADGFATDTDKLWLQLDWVL